MDKPYNSYNDLSEIKAGECKKSTSCNHEALSARDVFVDWQMSLIRSYAVDGKWRGETWESWRKKSQKHDTYLAVDIGHIYVLDIKTHFKIGFTGQKNPYSRVNQFKGLLPEPPLLRCVFRAYRFKEHYLHRKFSYLRTNGEWFRKDNFICNYFNVVNRVTGFTPHEIQKTKNAYNGNYTTSKQSDLEKALIRKNPGKLLSLLLRGKLNNEPMRDLINYFKICGVGPADALRAINPRYRAQFIGNSAYDLSEIVKPIGLRFAIELIRDHRRKSEYDTYCGWDEQ